jgi:hypothetical protein
VKQPPKRYPKLEKGGYMAKGGQTDDFYDNLQVHVQGVGTIYHGQSMKAAIKKADAYLLKNPKAEVVIVDEKYGDEYDLEGNQVENEDEYAKGGEVRFVDEFSTNNGIEISTAKTEDGKTLYGAQITMYPLQRIVPFIHEDKDIVVQRAKKIHSDMAEHLSNNDGEYKKMAKGGYFAKGGAMEHGLKRGDTIIDDMSWDNSVKVLNNKTGYAVVHLETGERKEMKAMGGEIHRTQD